MMIKEETCCLTGHRPKSLPWGYDETKQSCIDFKKDLHQKFLYALNLGKKCFLTGMAEGFDMIGTEILIQLRKEHKQIKIIAVVPCKNQEIKWSEKQQQRYKNILKECNEIIILSDVYTPTCMNDRNKYMVDKSSLVIACFNGKSSGTGNTIKLAQMNNCQIEILNPNDYK